MDISLHNFARPSHLKAPTGGLLGAQYLSSTAFEATAVFAVANMGGGSNVRCNDLLDGNSTITNPYLPSDPTRLPDAPPSSAFLRMIAWPLHMYRLPP